MEILGYEYEDMGMIEQLCSFEACLFHNLN